MGMLGAIQEIAKNQMGAKSLTDLVYGTVDSIDPLKIQLDQDKKVVLTEDFLILTKNVQNYKSTITINGKKETCTINNALVIGDKVGMIQKAGGQEFIILDKV